LSVLLATQEEYNAFDQGQVDHEALQCAELAVPALPDTVTEAVQVSPPADVHIIPGTSAYTSK